jgi:hypothetical protein
MTLVIDLQQLLVAGAVFGIFNGIGNAIGQYISNKHIIERIEIIRNGHPRIKKDN